MIFFHNTPSFHFNTVTLTLIYIFLIDAYFILVHFLTSVVNPTVEVSRCVLYIFTWFDTAIMVCTLINLTKFHLFTQYFSEFQIRFETDFPIDVKKY